MESDNHLISIDDGLMVFETNQPSPIVISIPHDGLPFREFSGFFQPRVIGYKGRDLNVWPIAKDILTLVNINAIRGLMPRTLIDYNRAWPIGINYYPLTQKETHTALDDSRLADMYYKYHVTIDQIISRSIREFGKKKTLLIDLHGFSKQPPYSPEGGYDLILGTGNRISIPHGDIDKKFSQYMTDLGYKVFLPTDVSVGDLEDYYSADFTTRHHSQKHNINAIQIEVAFRFRNKDSIELGQKLSRDFAKFARNHCL